MLIDVGDPLPIQTMEVRDTAGALANAGAMTLTITLPDGTSVTPGFTNTVTGVYVPNVYVTAEVGRHVIRWVGTGLNAAAYTEAFDVRPALATGILSLADAKQHLNLTSTSQDDELRIYIEAVTEAIEAYVGPVGRRTVTETVYPTSGVLLLSTSPVLSITSITPYAGVALGAGTYTLRPGGFVYPATYAAGFYAPEYAVVYVVGRASVPAAVNMAARLVLERLWEPQRGGSVSPQIIGATATDVGVEHTAFSYLKSFGVRELLDPYRLAPAVA